jgi:hypothetical protein
MAKSWKIPQSDVNLLSHIDVKDVVSCEFAVDALYALVQRHHGRVTAQNLFGAKVLTKRGRAGQKNFYLMVAYARMKKPVDRVAAELAEDNKTLPPEERWGPTGSTSQSTMAKHLRREIKKMRADRQYFYAVEFVALCP